MLIFKLTHYPSSIPPAANSQERYRTIHLLQVVARGQEAQCASEVTKGGYRPPFLGNISYCGQVASGFMLTID
jgi:hypothetical protein